MQLPYWTYLELSRQSHDTILKSLPSYIKDSNHALEIFRNFNFSGENKFIFTMDITSLYTVMPNNEGLQALFLMNVLSKNRARKPYSF